MDKELTNKEKDAIKKTRGRKGEDLAADYLRKQGYKVIERNFRCKAGEIDLIGVKERTISFVEVKARTRTDYGMPREAVNRKKQRRLLMAAQLYLKIHPGFAAYNCSMDIIEILYTNDGAYIRHNVNAFSI